MADSRTRARNIQDEPRVSSSAIKKETTKNNNKIK